LLTLPPVSELAVLAGALLAAGAATGLLAGVFGVGGGAVAVPILYWAFGLLNVPDAVRMPLCVGTSLAVIIPTSIRSFQAHRAKGAVDVSVLRVWAIPVVVGVVIGSAVARFAPANLFKLVFVLVATVSAVRLLFGKDAWRAHGELRDGPLMRGYGVLIGILSVLMGIGGGQLSNLFMSFYGRPIHQAVATSSGLGVLISIPGALGAIYAGWPRMAELPPLSLGYVSMIAVLAMMPTSIWLAPVGARLAHRLSKRHLEIGFGVFLLLVSARFAAGLFS
jgi:uncharacterized protein